MKKTACIFFGILFPFLILAQTEPNEIALANDDFRDAFYESLTQKAIENYDKSIIALDKCLQIEPNSAVVFFEYGKNYLAQKEYKKAYDSFEKATQIDPKNKWYWVGMYDVCYETKNYTEAIIIVNKLINFNSDYKDDLVSLYMTTVQYDKALVLINELNDKVGKSDLRDKYKAQILKDAKYQGSEKDNLLEQIKKNPKDEANYMALIYLYSESNQEEKAFEITQQLATEIPNSVWAQVGLFKYHLNNNEGEAAVKSMNMVFESNKIDNKIKHRILNEFLIYALDKPQYDADLEKAITYFQNDKDVKVAKEIGRFYQNKKQWSKAIVYYEKHLKSNPDDIEVQILLLQVYTENKQFNVLAIKANDLIESFPLLPQFYYFAGLANNQLKQFEKAKDFLEMGLDYLVDDIALEINFNIQLGEAYSGLGNESKKEAYFLKAEKLIKQQKQ